MIFFDKFSQDDFQLLPNKVCQVVTLQDNDDGHEEEEDDGRQEVLENVEVVSHL